MVITIKEFIVATNKCDNNNWMPIWLLCMYDTSKRHIENMVSDLFYQRKVQKSILELMKSW